MGGQGWRHGTDLERVLRSRHNLGPALPGQNLPLSPNSACLYLYHLWLSHFQRAHPVSPHQLTQGDGSRLPALGVRLSCESAQRGLCGPRVQAQVGAGSVSSQPLPMRCCEGAGPGQEGSDGSTFHTQLSKASYRAPPPTPVSALGGVWTGVSEEKE